MFQVAIFKRDLPINITYTFTYISRKKVVLVMSQVKGISSLGSWQLLSYLWKTTLQWNPPVHRRSWTLTRASSTLKPVPTEKSSAETGWLHFWLKFRFTLFPTQAIKITQWTGGRVVWFKCLFAQLQWRMSHAVVWLWLNLNSYVCCPPQPSYNKTTSSL